MTQSSSTTSDLTRSHRGSLRSKLVLTIAAIFLVFVVVDDIVRRVVISPQFQRMEQADGVRDANRILAAIRSESSSLLTLVQQMAAGEQDWDMPETSESALAQGQWLACAAIDDEDSTMATIVESQGTTPADLSDWLSQIATQPSSDQTIDGLFLSTADESLQLFAATRVQADEHCLLVLGREMDDKVLAELGRRTQIDFELHPTQLDDPLPLKISNLDQETLLVKVPLRDFQSIPIAEIEILVPRLMSASLHEMHRVARHTFVIGCVAALLLLLLLIQRIVVAPILAMRDHTASIARDGLTAEPLDLDRADEIGELAIAFDDMVVQMRQARQRLAETSRAAGMSQVADTVIHNVGNVLTNINSLIETAGDHVHGLRVSSLDKLAQCLRDSQDDKDLLQATPDYLDALGHSMASDQQSLLDILNSLSTNVQHIHDVIRDQQRHAQAKLETDAVSIDRLLAEAIECCRSRLDQEKIQVKCDQLPGIDVSADQSLLLQVFINIISNARKAFVETPVVGRELIIVLRRASGRVIIEFADNGCGISRETLPNVFDAHFTTRADGSGLGLHFCSVSLARMDGNISVKSEGDGKGATFAITLPVHQSSYMPNSALTKTSTKERSK
ncbi:MAG: HAMP domain-containing sensor histidine kinase [Planctomycetota bacterium]